MSAVTLSFKAGLAGSNLRVDRKARPSINHAQGLRVFAATQKMKKQSPEQIESADRVVDVPGFEKAEKRWMKVSTKGAAAAQKNLGYSGAQQKSAFGGKVYKLPTKGGNVDEYSPIYSPEFFGDDFVTGCSDKTYGLILGASAAAAVALPALVLVTSVATGTEPVYVFPFNL